MVEPSVVKEKKKKKGDAPDPPPPPDPDPDSDDEDVTGILAGRNTPVTYCKNCDPGLRDFILEETCRWQMINLYFNNPALNTSRSKFLSLTCTDSLHQTIRETVATSVGLATNLNLCQRRSLLLLLLPPHDDLNDQLHTSKRYSKHFRSGACLLGRITGDTADSFLVFSCPIR